MYKEIFFGNEKQRQKCFFVKYLLSLVKLQRRLQKILLSHVKLQQLYSKTFRPLVNVF